MTWWRKQLSQDTRGPAYHETGTGWVDGTWVGKNRGPYRAHPPGDPGSTACWVFSPLPPGDYRVTARFLPHGNRTRNAAYQVFDHDVLESEAVADQQEAPTATLGTFHIMFGSLMVVLHASADGYVVADRIGIEKSPCVFPDCGYNPLP